MRPIAPRLAIAVAMAGMAFASPRDAEAAPKAVKDAYDDVTSIIEDLIVAKVGQNIPVFARKAPALCYHFRDAFERMSANQWALVAPALRNGLASLAADFVYVGLEGSEKDLSSALRTYQQSASSLFGPDINGTSTHKPLESCTAAQWDTTNTRSKFEAACASNDEDLRCQLARFAESATRGDRTEAEDVAQNVAMKLLLETKPKDSPLDEGTWTSIRPNRTVLKNTMLQLLSGDRELSAEFSELGDTCTPSIDWFFGLQSVSPHLRTCAAAFWESPVAFTNLPKVAVVITPAKGGLRELSLTAEQSDDIVSSLGEASKVVARTQALLGDAQLTHLKIVGEHGAVLLDSPVTDGMVTKPAAAAAPQASKILFARSPESPSLDRHELTRIVAALHGNDDDLVKAVLNLPFAAGLEAKDLTHVRIVSGDRTLFQSAVLPGGKIIKPRLDSAFGPLALGTRHQRALRLFAKLGLDEDRDAWTRFQYAYPLWSSVSALRSSAGSEFSSTRPSGLDALYGALGTHKSTLNLEFAKAVVASRMFAPKERSDLLGLIQLLNRVTPEFGTGNAKDEQAKNEATHRRFLFDFAAYLVAADGPSSDVAREAFRATTVSLLAQSRSAGFPPRKYGSWNWPARENGKATDRKERDENTSAGFWDGWSLGTWLVNFVKPEVGLRVSFSNTYVNEIGDDGVRYVPTLVMGTPLRVGITDFAGIQMSTIDPLASLSEWVLRKEADYGAEEKILIDMIRPRLDVWVGIPELTREVFLTGGFGARFLRAAHCTREANLCDADQVGGASPEEQARNKERSYKYQVDPSAEFSMAVLILF